MAHNLSVVKHVSDRVAVMYIGKIVEMAATADIHAQPAHPYTEALLSSVPRPDPRLRGERALPEGEVADPAHAPAGCAFHPRCRYAQDVCRKVTPALEQISPNCYAACHRARELSLAGIGTPGAVARSGRGA